MDNAYTFEKKKKLVDRIHKLSSRSEFEQVKKIILEKNPELDSMKNQNGLFLQFNYLTNDTYVEISSFLDKNDKLKLKRLKEEVMDTSEIVSDEETFTNNNSDKNMSKKLRLTNTESHIINRVKYEKELKKNETLADVDELHIYDPETSHKKQTKKSETKSDIFVAINEEQDKKKSKKIVVKNDPDVVDDIVVKKATKQTKKKN